MSKPRRLVRYVPLAGPLREGETRPTVRVETDQWIVQWYDHDGKRHTEACDTFAAAKAALRRRLAEVEKAKAIRELGLEQTPEAALTFGEAAEAWLAKRPATRQRDDESRLRVHCTPFLGEYRLDKITPTVLEAFARHLEAKRTGRPGEKHDKGPARTLKPNTIKNCLVLVSKLLADHGFRGVTITYKVPTSGYGWIQEPEAVGRFLAECRPDWFRVAAAISVYAGLRQGEVAGLRRDALDLDRGIVRVDRSYDGPTKGKAVRWVRLAPQLAAVLKPWLLAHPGPLVVTRPEVQPDGTTVEVPIAVEHDTLAEPTRRACKRAGVPRVTFHQLRHTYASHLVQRVPLSVAGAMLGHKDPRTTLRYAHLDTESLAQDTRLDLDFAAPAGNVVAFPSPAGKSAR